MGGLAAILDFAGNPLPPGQCQTMLGAMTYAPANSSYVWQEGSIALGQNAGQSEGKQAFGMQYKLPSDSKPVLVMDGYLANREELGNALGKGAAELQGDSDSSLILAAYREWGISCLDHFDGAFAFVLWDPREGQLLAARDHMGLRPLFYHQDGTRIAFASDLAAIAEVLPEELSPDLAFFAEAVSRKWYSRDATLWNGIKRIAGGHFLIASRNGVSVHQYWSPPVGVTIRHARDEDYCEEYREVLAESVRGAARGMAPMAFEVSGGLDSSGIYALAQNLRDAGHLPGGEIRAYALAGPEGGEADEIAYARAVTDHWDDHLTTRPLFLPDLGHFAHEARRQKTLPPYPNITQASELHAAMQQDGCRIVISGQGGDQWLDGMAAYHGDALRGLDLSAMITAFRADAATRGPAAAWQIWRRQVSQALKPAFLRRLKRVLKQRPINIYPARTELLTRFGEHLLAQQETAFFARYGSLGPHYKQMKAEYPFMQTMLDGLCQHISQFGLEYRYPMLSRRFVEFCCKTPEHVRLRGGMTKWVHRTALADLLPAKVAQREDKAAFSFVFERHYPAIFALLAEAQPDCFTQIVNRLTMTGLQNQLCNAEIDDPHLWQVWGLYSLSEVGGDLAGNLNRG